MFSRDIKDRTVLRVHECDSKEPQRVTEKPEVRGRTIQIPASAAQGYYGTVPSSAVTSQVRVNKCERENGQNNHITQNIAFANNIFIKKAGTEKSCQ